MKNQQVMERKARGFGTNLMNQSTHQSLEACFPTKSSFNNSTSKILKKTQSQSTMDIEEISLEKCQSQVYSQEIMTYIFSKPYLVISNYFLNQKEINSQMRGILLNWMVNVHSKYQLSEQTLFMTIDIIDNFLQKTEISKKQFQLLGITALWISAKYVQVYQVPKMSNLVYISDNAYTQKDILEMQSRIIKLLQFNLLENNIFVYIQLLLSYTSMDQKDRSFANYFSEICLIDWGLRRQDQKNLAAGIIYLIRRMKKQIPYWDDELISVSGIAQSSAKFMAKEIYLVLNNIQTRTEFNSLRKKYSAQKYFGVGKMIIKHRSQ